MSVVTLIGVILVLALVGYWLGRSRALAMEKRDAAGRLHSLPQYYGYYVALWCGLPAVALLLIWLLAQQVVVDRLLLAGLPAGDDGGRHALADRPDGRDHQERRRGHRLRPAQTGDHGGGRPLRHAGVRGARGAGRGRAGGRHRRARLGAAPGRAALSRARRGRADHRLPAGAVLADRDPDDARHRDLAADRERALLRARAAARVPVRPQLGAADRDPGGSGGGCRRVRRGAGLLGHHHGQRGRVVRRPADRHLCRDLHGRVREQRRAHRGQAPARDPGRHPDDRLRLLRGAGGLAAAARPRRLDRPGRLADRGDRAGRGDGHHADPVHLVARPTMR